MLGTVLNISGFTLEQRIENIIKYPHLEGLVREGRRKGDFVYSDFWKYIEIDGTLHRIRDVWDDLEDTHNLPSHPGLMCDYVVRRYLLERDVNHMNHKYQLYGTLEPFLTLCFTADDYTSLGYTDLVEIAKQCVRSRVSYKQSRNPIIRRLKQNA